MDGSIAHDQRAALVESHAWIVAQFAARYAPRARGADLAEAGLLGLCEAAEHFRPRPGVKFASYAWNWVKGRVLEELRLAHVVPVSKRAALGKTLFPVEAPRIESIPTDGPASERRKSLSYERFVFARGLFVDGELEQCADEQRRRRVARQRIARLASPDHRRVAFRALQGRTIEQIAASLELPVSRVVRLLGEAERELQQREAA